MADFQHPLAPAPRGDRRSSDSGQQQLSKPKRTNIGVACSACKARKLKCSGNPPCQNCLKNQLECTVDRTGDKRRKTGIKRKIETLENRKDLLLNLVCTIRESGDRRMVQLLDMIRSDASLAEIKFYLDDERPRVEDRKRAIPARLREVLSNDHNGNVNGNGNGSGSGGDEQQQSPIPAMRSEVNPEFLADIPRFDVPAAPWTTVVQDAKLVSQLVSLWFTWFHPFLNWVDRDLFIQDMRSGNPKARFCSPLLVNAMLAVACTYSNYDWVYTVLGDMASKGTHFYHEAKQLLEDEEGRITLTTVQGLGLLSVYAGLTCKNRYGWIYQNHLAYAVSELCRQNPLPRTMVNQEALQKSHMIDHASWGLFNIATIKAFAYHKIPPIQPPNRPLAQPPCQCDDNWYPYPMQLEAIEAHTGCLFHALCRLSAIVYDVAWIYLHGQTQLNPLELGHKIHELHARLQDWTDRLPPCLKEPESIQVPHLLCLHMYYYTVCIALDQYAPSIKPDPDYKTLINDTPSLFFSRRISRLMRIHRSAWGIDRIPLSNIFWITTALLTLLDNLSDPQNRDAFSNLAVAAKAFSRRWVLGQAKLEQLQQRASDRGIALPDETGPLFSDLEFVAWRKRAKV